MFIYMYVCACIHHTCMYVHVYMYTVGLYSAVWLMLRARVQQDNLRSYNFSATHWFVDFEHCSDSVDHNSMPLNSLTYMSYVQLVVCPKKFPPNRLQSIFKSTIRKELITYLCSYHNFKLCLYYKNRAISRPNHISRAIHRSMSEGSDSCDYVLAQCESL